MNWYIGQRVVCVKSVTGCAIVGRTYTVSGVAACRCGMALQCIGIYCRPERLPVTSCVTCGTRIGDGKWTRAEYFRPLEPLQADMDRIEQEAQVELLEPTNT